MERYWLIVLISMVCLFGGVLPQYREKNIGESFSYFFYFSSLYQSIHTVVWLISENEDNACANDNKIKLRIKKKERKKGFVHCSAPDTRGTLST